MPSNSIENDEITIRDLFSSLFAMRWWILFALVTAIVVVGLYLSYGVIRHVPAKSHAIEVHFTFASAVEGKYPDGQDFSSGHLLSNPVLEQVVEANNLAENYGVNAFELLSMLSLSFETREAARSLANFEEELQRLKSANAPYTRIAEFTQSFEDQMKRNTQSAQRLILVDIDDRLPIAVIEKVLFDVPKFWSDFYVRDLGVTSSNLPMYHSELIDADQAVGFDYPIAVDFITDGLERAQSYLEEVSQIQGSNLISDRETGWFLGDISNQILQLQRFEIREKVAPLANLGVSRDLDFTPILYADKLEQLAFEQDKLRELKASIVDLLAEQRRKGSAVVNGESVQLSGDFLDKIVELTNETGDQQLTNDLKAQRLEIDKSVAENNEEAKRIRARLNSFNETGLFPTQSGLTREGAEELISKAIPDIIGRANDIWRAIHRIRLSADRQYDATNGKLFKVGLDEVEVKKLQPLVTTQLLITSFALGFLAFIAVFFIGLTKHLVRRPA